MSSGSSLSVSDTESTRSQNSAVTCRRSACITPGGRAPWSTDASREGSRNRAPQPLHVVEPEEFSNPQVSQSICARRSRERLRSANETRRHGRGAEATAITSGIGTRRIRRGQADEHHELVNASPRAIAVDDQSSLRLVFGPCFGALSWLRRRSPTINPPRKTRLDKRQAGQNGPLSIG